MALPDVSAGGGEAVGVWAKATWGAATATMGARYAYLMTNSLQWN
jgi:hypothetical protein